MYLFEFFKTYLFDIALYAAVDGNNLTLHTGIVGEFHVARMEELTAHPYSGCRYYCNGENIRNDFFSANLHIFPDVKSNR